MRRRFWLLACVVLVPWLVQAQPLPTLDPRSFLWTTWDFQEPDGTAVFVFDGNSAGDILAEAGRAVLLRHGAQALPLACPQNGFFSAGSLNRHGEIVGSCVREGRSQGAILTERQGLYAATTLLTLPGVSLTGTGINDWGHVVGYLVSDIEGGPHGVFAVGNHGHNGGPVVTLKATFPGQEVQSTILTGIINEWFASGYYLSLDPTPTGKRLHTHGLVLGLWNSWYQWDAPGATDTFLWDLSTYGLRAVGAIRDTQGQGHSVLADPATGQWYILDHPNPDVLFTDVSGIVDGDPLTFVGRLITPHPTDPNQNKVLGFRAVLKPDGFDAPPGSQPATAALATTLTPQQQGAQRSALLLPTATPRPRAPVQLNTETCEEGPGVIVPMRLRQILGCP